MVRAVVHHRQRRPRPQMQPSTTAVARHYLGRSRAEAPARLESCNTLGRSSARLAEHAAVEQREAPSRARAGASFFLQVARFHSGFSI